MGLVAVGRVGGLAIARWEELVATVRWEELVVTKILARPAHVYVPAATSPTH